MKISTMMGSLCTVAALLSCSSIANAAVGDKLITCKGEFALCSIINCAASPDGKTASCKCDVYNDTNVGTTTCAERDTAAAQGTPLSEYSAIHYLGNAKQKYPEQLCKGKKSETLQYADCWNVKGTMDSNGTTATYTCPIATPSGDTGFWMQAPSCKEGADLCATVAKKGNKVVINGSGFIAGPVVMNAGMKAATGQPLGAGDFCKAEDAVAAGVKK